MQKGLVAMVFFVYYLRMDTTHTTITVTASKHYGQTLIYVSDPRIAKNLRTLTGRKSLTARDVEALKELGFLLVKPATAQITL
mgnify:CR=1 FL=1